MPCYYSQNVPQISSVDPGDKEPKENMGVSEGSSRLLTTRLLLAGDSIFFPRFMFGCVQSVQSTVKYVLGLHGEDLE